MLRSLLSVLLSLLSVAAFSQHMYGTVSDDKSAVQGVQVTNLTHGGSALSNEKGIYRITVKPGDSIKVSSLGYEEVKFKLPTQIAGDYLRNIYLTPNVYMLDAVDVDLTTPYQKDSTARRQLYGQALSREWVSGTSAVFHPFSYLGQKVSRKSKQRHRFQQNFSQWEAQKFIDTRYTAEAVAQLTGLQGDSLAYFMNAYPLPLDFARAATEMEFTMWVRYNYRTWIKHPVIPEIEQIKAR